MKEIKLYSNSLLSDKVPVVSLSPACSDMNSSDVLTGYLTDYPEFGYSTDWGDYDNSSLAFVGKPLVNLAGGGTGTLGKVLRTAAGANARIPYLTDYWTQLNAKRESKDGFIKFTLSIAALPPYEFSKNGNTYLVEGSEFFSERTGVSSMIAWLRLCKKYIMPETTFSASAIVDNVVNIVDNVTKIGPRLGDSIKNNVSMKEFSAENLVMAASQTIDSVLESIGSTTTVSPAFFITISQTKLDGKREVIFNGTQIPFYLTGATLTFSPRTVKLWKKNGSSVVDSGEGIPDLLLLKLDVESAYTASSDAYATLFKSTKA